MKIIIVGGGIGGLSAYHALRNLLLPSLDTFSVKLYEAYPSPASTTEVIGGGLGLAPNGLHALSKIHPSAVQYIQQQGYETSCFIMRNAKGKQLCRLNLGTKEKFGGVTMTSTARATVHNALLADIGDNVAGKSELHWGMKVKEIREGEDKVLVVFEDGTEEECDILLGADGVHGITRKTIYGDDRYRPHYDGLTGIGGFLPLSSFPLTMQEGIKRDGVVMTFSRNGFFGLSLVLPEATENKHQFIMWWSTFAIDPPPKKDTLPDHVLEMLVDKHDHWVSPYDIPASDQQPEGVRLYKTVVTLACRKDDDSVNLEPTSARGDTKRTKMMVLPVYITDRLLHWTSYTASNPLPNSKPDLLKKLPGRILLLGDAAHPMPPDSGQGASCAAEDALCIALMLKHLSKSKKSITSPRGNMVSNLDTIHKLAVAYETIRLQRVKEILDLAKHSGNAKRELSAVGELVRDIFLKLASSLAGKLNQRMYGYQIDVEVEKYIKASLKN